MDMFELAREEPAIAVVLIRGVRVPFLLAGVVGTCPGIVTAWRALAGAVHRGLDGLLHDGLPGVPGTPSGTALALVGQDSAAHLIQFYRFEQRLEIALAEAIVALALDD